MDIILLYADFYPLQPVFLSTYLNMSYHMLIEQLKGKWWYLPFVVTLECIKLYLTKFSERKHVWKMCCIIIHIINNPFTVNKYCIYKLLYMIVRDYMNKTFYNNVFFFLGVYFYELVYVFTYTQNPYKI